MLGVAVDAVGLLHFLAGVAPGLAGAGVQVEAEWDAWCGVSGSNDALI